MKAAVYTHYGPPDVVRIAEVEKPAPRENEVLVRVRATTVNRTDCGFRTPEYGILIRPMHGLLRPRRTILGSEFAGEVEAVGEKVASFSKGDQVFGMTGARFGAHAEYLCAPEDSAIALKPSNVSFEDAAAVCDGLMLANNYLMRVDFQKRKSILINGGSGSIGSASVQLAKYYGANVTAVSKTTALDLVRSLGADHTIDYTKEDFTLTAGTYDVVLDAVGKSSFFRCRNLMKEDGLFFSTDLGFLAQNLFLPLWTAIFSRKKVMFPIPKAGKKDVEFYGELMESGKYRAVIDRTYPLEQIVEAYRYVETGEKVGNVVIAIHK